MNSAALSIANSVIRPALRLPVEGVTPRVVPEPVTFQGDTVKVGLGPLSFKAATKHVEPAIKGISEGMGVTAGTLAGAVTTALGVACYPACSLAVGITTAAACMTADVEGDTALIRGAKRVALAAALAPAAALIAPAVMGAAVAVATEDMVSQTAEWGISRYLVSEVPHKA